MEKEFSENTSLLMMICKGKWESEKRGLYYHFTWFDDFYTNTQEEIYIAQNIVKDADKILIPF